MRWILLLALLLAAPAAATETLPLRERAAITDRILKDRLDTLLPGLMREAGIDMWILVAREYNEDPVLATMLNATSFHARRRTILVLHDPGPGQPVERLTVSRYGLGGLFEPAWVPEEEPDQWQRLAAIVAERNPRRIGINVSSGSAFADGLTAGEYRGLTQALSPDFRQRLVSAEPLAIAWLETRTPAEIELYGDVVKTAHAIIREGLSGAAIQPGVTTAADLQWWYRERIAQAKLDTWFHPSVAIFREGAAGELTGNAVIQPGDLVWTDIGILYLGLATDTQTFAYVLKPGETEAPAGLRRGLANANRVQDALTSSFATGRSGNEILGEARRKAIAAGLNPSIYSHPVGKHGHGAGAAIGFWDNQQPTEKGEHRLRPNTLWAIELSHSEAVPEWGGQLVPFRTEVNALFDGRQVRYIDGRQTEYLLIPSHAP
ncbi:MAG: M24 family metallopeptidase [Sphingomonadaceae bacterium]